MLQNFCDVLHDSHISNYYAYWGLKNSKGIFKSYDFFLNRIKRIITTTIIAMTINIPKLIPALKISPITLHELTIKDMSNKENTMQNFDFVKVIIQRVLIYLLTNI